MNTVTISFTYDQLNVLNSVLALGPYGQVAPLIADINRQLSQPVPSTPEE